MEQLRLTQEWDKVFPQSAQVRITSSPSTN